MGLYVWIYMYQNFIFCVFFDYFIFYFNILFVDLFYCVCDVYDVRGDEYYGFVVWSLEDFREVSFVLFFSGF